MSQISFIDCLVSFERKYWLSISIINIINLFCGSAPNEEEIAITPFTHGSRTLQCTIILKFLKCSGWIFIKILDYSHCDGVGGGEMKGLFSWALTDLGKWTSPVNWCTVVWQETISNPLYKSEMGWSNGQCTGLWVKRSGFKTWPVHVLCSRARHHALTVSLSTQENKWVQAKCQGSLMKCRRVTLGWTSTPSREGVVILLVTSCDIGTRFSSCWVDVCVQT